MKKYLCKECGNKIIYGVYETYCKGCGLVLEDSPINFGQESFEGDPEKAAKTRRTGAPITWRNPDWSTTYDMKTLFKGRKPRWIR